MKKAIKQYVFMCNQWSADTRQKEWVPEVWAFKAAECEYRVFISEQVVEIEIPDNWDPVPGQVAALEEEKRTALAEYQKRVEQINHQLSKLQAIEHL